MLRVIGASASSKDHGTPFFNIDNRKKQVTLYDPAFCGTPTSTAPEDRRVGVAAPKMFAFDAIFTEKDSQTEVCSTALIDIIHAVINGTDGCIFCFGHTKLGKTNTMLGSPESPGALGIIPTAISWLFRAIHEQKQKTGARFSVRVSAVAISQPSQKFKDLLVGYATDCEQSPGFYLRDDPLFALQLQSQSELRVPNMEKAAFYLDAALNSRRKKDDIKDSHFLYTLHIYQYNVAGKGGVAGGRSRLHLIDLGSSDKNRSGSVIPLSGLGNILLAIFNGQKHLPYREHKITNLLKECLGSLTCHAAMIAHVSLSPENYTETLTTVQLASRIHRMRRKKLKLISSMPPTMVVGSSNEEFSRVNASAGSDIDPSSSEQSADTVIYMGPADGTATDGEHPPLYIPSLNFGDNRYAIGKSHRGSIAEIRPALKSKYSIPSKNSIQKHGEDRSFGGRYNKCNKYSSGGYKFPPARKLNSRIIVRSNLDSLTGCSTSNMMNTARHEEQWIDGPRISKQKVAEARNILSREHIKKETWVDGPMRQFGAQSSTCGIYGFMDTHKKSMIRKWVENQTVQLIQVFPSNARPDNVIGVQRSSEPTATEFSNDASVSKQIVKDKFGAIEKTVGGSFRVSESEELLGKEKSKCGVTYGTAVIKPTSKCIQGWKKNGESMSKNLDEEVNISLSHSSSALQSSTMETDVTTQQGAINKPLVCNSIGNDCLGVDDEEIELEIVEITDSEDPVPMQDSCLQVTEEDIALCMREDEFSLKNVDKPTDHVLENLSASLSVKNAADFDRGLPKPCYGPPSLFDEPFHPKNPCFYVDEYVDLLLSKSYHQTGDIESSKNSIQRNQSPSSKLGLVPIANGQVTTRCHQSLSLCDVFVDGTDVDYSEFNNGNCSIYSEPNYRPTEQTSSICDYCKINLVQSDERRVKVESMFERNVFEETGNLSSLRLPDGSSNPSLDDENSEENKVQQLVVCSSSKIDHEEENKDKNVSSRKKHNHSTSIHSSDSFSPGKKAVRQVTEKSHEIPMSNKLVQANECDFTTCDTTFNSAALNSNPSSKGVLKRTSSSSSNKNRRVDGGKKIITTPAATALTKKHLYVNKSFPSNEGSDSGHESNVSPKVAKIHGRPRLQIQCESSGYESVVSFTSSLDSESGINPASGDAEELHDSGASQPGWWCWCVGGRPSAERTGGCPQRYSISSSPGITMVPSISRTKD